MTWQVRKLTDDSFDVIGTFPDGCYAEASKAKRECELADGARNFRIVWTSGNESELAHAALANVGVKA